MKKDLLDSIDVKMPCSESWEEMTGNDEVRFCSHCAQDIYNISAMTRAKAAKLVKDSNGKLCVRYTRNSNGDVMTAPSKFTQIKRRATIAAGVLSASLTLSTLANAQNETTVPKDNVNQTLTDKSETKQDVFTISGTVKDQTGAAIPDATVWLKNSANGMSRTIVTNSNGIYEFPYIVAAVYQIKVEASGYQQEIKDIKIIENVRIDFDLREGAWMGLIDVEPRESKMSKIIKSPIRLFKKIF